MNRVKLVYGQPRPASHNPEVVIFEEKSRVFDGTNIEQRQAIDEFLAEGSVACGGTKHKRIRISVEPCVPLPPVLEPDPRLVPENECV